MGGHKTAGQKFCKALRDRFIRQESNEPVEGRLRGHTVISDSRSESFPQLSASLAGDTLTVHAPKVQAPKALDEEKAEQIEIHYEEPKAALEDSPMEEEEEAVVENLEEFTNRVA